MKMIQQIINETEDFKTSAHARDASEQFQHKQLAVLQWLNSSARQETYTKLVKGFYWALRNGSGGVPLLGLDDRLERKLVHA